MFNFLVEFSSYLSCNGTNIWDNSNNYLIWLNDFVTIIWIMVNKHVFKYILKYKLHYYRIRAIKLITSIKISAITLKAFFSDMHLRYLNFIEGYNNRITYFDAPY